MILHHGQLLKIKNKSNKSIVYCEALEIDDNFIKEYNQRLRVNIKKNEKTIIINRWYRSRLGGVETKRIYDLVISCANCLWENFVRVRGTPK